MPQFVSEPPDAPPTRRAAVAPASARWIELVEANCPKEKYGPWSRSMFGWMTISEFCWSNSELDEDWFEWELRNEQDDGPLVLVPCGLNTRSNGTTQFRCRPENWKQTLRLPRVMNASECKGEVEGQGRPLLIHESLIKDLNHEVHRLTQVVLMDVFGEKRFDYVLLTFHRTFTREELLSWDEGAPPALAQVAAEMKSVSVERIALAVSQTWAERVLDDTELACVADIAIRSEHHLPQRIVHADLARWQDGKLDTEVVLRHETIDEPKFEACARFLGKITAYGGKSTT